MYICRNKKIKQRYVKKNTNKYIKTLTEMYEYLHAETHIHINTKTLGKNQNI